MRFKGPHIFSIKKVFLFFSLVFFWKNSSSSINITAVCDTAFAGNNKLICGTSDSVFANTPLVGMGTWSVFSGTGVFANNSNPNTAITGLGLGTNIFIWTISGGACPTVTDTVAIRSDTTVSVSVLGFDTTICATSAILIANIPTVGTGEWGLLSGTGTITSISAASTTVNGLSVGSNIFGWKISNGGCFSIDQITITRDQFSYTAMAGLDKIICNDSTFLGGNTPPYGAGFWTLISGSASFNSNLNSGTLISGLVQGDTSVFVWSITNGVCAASSDTAIVIYNLDPSLSHCGADQSLCSSSSVISANLPTAGTGIWSIVTGNATITNSLMQTTTVSSIAAGINIFVWTISNGACLSSTDTLVIYNTANPSMANAGLDQEICSLSSLFAAVSPTIGTGLWTLLSGAGNIVSPTSPTSIVSNLSFGQNIFIWTTSNGICPSLFDSVIITVDYPSTNSNAGIDFTVCGPVANLSGSAPTNGIGTWTVFSGQGNISSANLSTATVTGLGVGNNIFVWSIVNGVCAASSDSIIITSIISNSLANAGPNQEICQDSTSLTANSPSIGIGQWSILTPGAILSSLTNFNVTVTNLIVGNNIFIWTISNGICPNTQDSIIVKVDSPPTIANAGPDFSSEIALATLNANVVSVGIGTWNNLSSEGTLLLPNSNSSSFLVNDSGTFILTWTVTNGVCQVSIDTVVVKMDFIPIPEIITPNGDGQNDFFLIKALQFTQKITLTIYNRYGAQVFLDENYQHDFDGKNNNGVDLVEDTYFYQAHVSGVEKFKGYLVIKRK